MIRCDPYKNPTYNKQATPRHITRANSRAGRTVPLLKVLGKGFGGDAKAVDVADSRDGVAPLLGDGNLDRGQRPLPDDHHRALNEYCVDETNEVANRVRAVLQNKQATKSYEQASDPRALSRKIFAIPAPLATAG